MDREAQLAPLWAVGPQSTPGCKDGWVAGGRVCLRGASPWEALLGEPCPVGHWEQGASAGASALSCSIGSDK